MLPGYLQQHCSVFNLIGKQWRIRVQSSLMFNFHQGLILKAYCFISTAQDLDLKGQLHLPSSQGWPWFCTNVRKDKFSVLPFTQMLSHQPRTVLILNRVMTMAFITSRCFFQCGAVPFLSVEKHLVKSWPQLQFNKSFYALHKQAHITDSLSHFQLSGGLRE